MAEGRQPNRKLAALIAEAGLSHANVASAFVLVASENGAHDYLTISRSHVTHWVGGTQPSGAAPVFLCEALSRRLGRTVTPQDIGLRTPGESCGIEVDWDGDTLSALTDFANHEVDVDRRRALGGAAYSVAALALPSSSWWTRMAQRGSARSGAGTFCVGEGDVETVRELVSAFSRADQRRGGGHARSTVVHYLTSDVARLLRGSYAHEPVRRAMFSAAGELAYLAGWMAFDNGQHADAQAGFRIALKLAAEADDPPLAGHILRAMAHQAVDLGHASKGLEHAAASMDGTRYTLATPRERALLGVVHARALAASGDKRAAATALLKAEHDLANASVGDEEPGRVFFFGEASLAHETACTLRDTGDLAGAQREFRRSVRTRKSTPFARTHAVTLGYLGAVQARQGSIEEACATWSRALDAMDGIHSARTRAVVANMRSTVSPLRQRGIPAVAELDTRAKSYLAAT
jgi:tetratricopeptide (TPR) repeat protein